MFSTMMMEPLAILPMPMASPPMDMTVSATPPRSIRIRAIAIDSGMVSEAISAPRTSHMKISITSRISPAPIRIENCTWSSELMTRID